MQYRELGQTGIKVSEIGIGGEGFENKSYTDCENPDVRTNVGKALRRCSRDSCRFG